MSRRRDDTNRGRPPGDDPTDPQGIENLAWLKHEAITPMDPQPPVFDLPPANSRDDRTEEDPLPPAFDDEDEEFFPALPGETSAQRMERLLRGFDVSAQRRRIGDPVIASVTSGQDTAVYSAPATTIPPSVQPPPAAGTVLFRTTQKLPTTEAAEARRAPTVRLAGRGPRSSDPPAIASEPERKRVLVPGVVAGAIGITTICIVVALALRGKPAPGPILEQHPATVVVPPNAIRQVQATTSMPTKTAEASTTPSPASASPSIPSSMPTATQSATVSTTNPVATARRLEPPPSPTRTAPPTRPALDTSDQEPLP